MLTQEEQDLIAEAIASGKVRRFPTGHTRATGKRRGPKVNRVAVSMVATLARECLTDREIGEQIGKTRKAVQRIRHRHNIRAGVRRVV